MYRKGLIFEAAFPCNIRMLPPKLKPKPNRSLRCETASALQSTLTTDKDFVFIDYNVELKRLNALDAGTRLCGKCI